MTHTQQILDRAYEACSKNQHELARRVEVAPAVVHRWVHGHTRPSAEMIDRLAEVAGVETTEGAKSV